MATAELFRIDVEAKRQTEKALLVLTEAGDEVWVPQSLIDDESEVWKAGQEGTLVVPLWWAEKAGIA